MDHSGSILTSAPFIRFVIPLCLGVSMPLISSLSHPYTILILFEVIWLILMIFRKGNFYSQPLWGVFLFLLLFIFGQERVRKNAIIFPVLPKQQYFVVVDEYPEEKEKTFRLVGQFVNQEPRILVYLPKSSLVKNAKPGDVFSFEGSPELLKNDGNPFEFDYCRYLKSRGIGYRIFLKESQYCLINKAKQPNIFRNALIVRKKFVDCLSHSGISSENVHLIGSISFGAREEVDKETIQSFTNTGVIHVLAVSGMNVGLIYVILDFLFRFLKSRRFGYFLHSFIMLSGIWSYTLITGMSPSILRAAMMFSFVLLGTTLKRSSGIFNSLAVSAFLLIALNPEIIRDAGFQLSYAAVLSIVVIQPHIYKQIEFGRRLPDKIWLLISVTLAAQMGTIPFTLLFFHQFPVYFLLANMIVIPLVTLILYLSFVVVFLSFISGFLATLVAFVLNLCTDLVLLTVNSVEKLPHSILRGLYPSYFQLGVILLIGICLVYYIKSKRIMLIQTVLVLAIVLAISSGVALFYRQSRAEVVFFNIPGTRALALTSGRNAIVIYDRCGNTVEKIGYFMKPYFGERRIRNVEMFCLTDSLRFNGKNICAFRDFIFFKGIRIYVQPSDQKDSKDGTLFPSAEVIWLRNLNLSEEANQLITKSKIILCEKMCNLDTFHCMYPERKFLTVDQAVKLTMESSKPGNPSEMVCCYFNQAE